MKIRLKVCMYGFLAVLLAFSLGTSSRAASPKLRILSGMQETRSAEVGETYSSSIRIKNKTESPQRVKLYRRDFSKSYAGGVEYGKPGQDPRSNADWIDLGTNQLVVPPKETTSVNYKIKVPKKDLTGTYWSLIMVESVGQPEISPEEGKVGIGFAIRYGISIVTNIAQTGRKELKVVEATTEETKDGPVLRVGLKNTGTRLVRPETWANLYDKEKGTRVDRWEGSRRTIYPTCSTGYRIPLYQLTAGSYEAVVVFDGGGENVWGTRISFEISSGG